MKRKELSRTYVSTYNRRAVGRRTHDGFDGVLLDSAEGWSGISHQVVALYDLIHCQEILIETGMEEDEAAEWLEFNVTGAYLGSITAVFAVINRQPIATPLPG